MIKAAAIAALVLLSSPASACWHWSPANCQVDELESRVREMENRAHARDREASRARSQREMQDLWEIVLQKRAQLPAQRQMTEREIAKGDWTELQARCAGLKGKEEEACFERGLQ